MLNYFKKLKDRKEQKRIEAERKILRIKQEIKLIEDKAFQEANKQNEADRELNKSFNNICPKCGSKNIVDHIQRIQGSVNGSLYGTSSLFGGSTSGSINGSLDTNEVNKCNDCGHEWKKYKEKYVYYIDIIKDNCQQVMWALEEYYDAKHCTFDPMNLDEKYNSFEEKKNVLLNSANNYFYLKYIRNFWSGITIDAFQAVYKRYLSDWYWDKLMEYYDEELLISWGLKK